MRTVYCADKILREPDHVYLRVSGYEKVVLSKLKFTVRFPNHITCSYAVLELYEIKTKNIGISTIQKRKRMVKCVNRCSAVQQFATWLYTTYSKVLLPLSFVSHCHQTLSEMKVNLGKNCSFDI